MESDAMTPPAITVDEYSLVLGKRNVLTGCHVIGTSSSSDTACPCCNTRRLDDDGRQTLNEPAIIPSSRRQRNLIDDVEEDEDEERNACQSADEEVDTLPGVLHSGIQYNPTRVLAEGWVHKKGTGNDFFGSRAWKARYCRLVLAKVDGDDIDVPLLLLYWFPVSEVPSTVITLESTVVVPMDRENKDDWTKYCFNIVHARGEERTTRCFTAPQKGRDSWVCFINEALYNFEKMRVKAKQELTWQQQPVVITPPPKPAPSIWSSDTCVEMSVHSTVSPPNSPRLIPPRPPPRTDVLVGEAFLLDL